MKKILWAVVGLVVVVAAALWWFVLRGDEPAEVDLATAVAQLDETTTTAGPDEATTTAAPEEVSDGAAAVEEVAVEEAEVELDGLAGVWTVDTTIGDFDFDQATGSFAGFRVEEELTFGATTAVGRTGDVSGRIELGTTALETAGITVDMTTITTNESLRDGPTRRALATGEFPTATFTLTEPVSLPAHAADGTAFSFEAVGDLTIKGATNRAVFALDAQLVGDVIAVVGSTEVRFEDYGVQAPSAPIVVSVEDHGIIELQLLFTR